MRCAPASPRGRSPAPPPARNRRCPRVMPSPRRYDWLQPPSIDTAKLKLFGPRVIIMLKRLLPAVLSFALLAAPLPAAAIDYTDIWYNTSESGWGVNLIQAEDVIFVTFFIYGPNNQPTWYVAIIYRDTNGNFAGNLYSTVGPYFGGPWTQASYAPTLAGTASFYPSN